MEPFFTSDKCQNFTQAAKAVYGEPFVHPLRKIGGDAGKMLEVLAVGHWMTALDAQGGTYFARRYGLRVSTRGDRTLRDVRTKLGEFEIAIQDEAVEGESYKRWRVHPADLKRLQAYLNM